MKIANVLSKFLLSGAAAPVSAYEKAAREACSTVAGARALSEALKTQATDSRLPAPARKLLTHQAETALRASNALNLYLDLTERLPHVYKADDALEKAVERSATVGIENAHKAIANAETRVVKFETQAAELDLQCNTVAAQAEENQQEALRNLSAAQAAEDAALIAQAAEAVVAATAAREALTRQHAAPRLQVKSFESLANTARDELALAKESLAAHQLNQGKAAAGRAALEADRRMLDALLAHADWVNAEVAASRPASLSGLGDANFFFLRPERAPLLQASFFNSRLKDVREARKPVDWSAFSRDPGSLPRAVPEPISMPAPRDPSNGIALKGW